MTDSINVTWFNNKEIKSISKDKIKFTDDVFATYQDGDQIYFLGGDDGSWWVLAVYHQFWLEQISKNLYSYVTKGRRK